MKILKSKTWQFAAAGQEHEIVLFLCTIKTIDLEYMKLR